MRQRASRPAERTPVVGTHTMDRGDIMKTVNENLLVEDTRTVKHHGQECWSMELWVVQLRTTCEGTNLTDVQPVGNKSL